MDARGHTVDGWEKHTDQKEFFDANFLRRNYVIQTEVNALFAVLSFARHAFNILPVRKNLKIKT